MIVKSIECDGKLTPHIENLVEPKTFSQLLEYYENKMMNYIYAIPHIPPTLFELKVRHIDVKNDVLRLGEICLNENGKNEGDKSLTKEQLNNQIDQLFATIMVKNMNEYKLCQTGFIIGWKCHNNKPKNQHNHSNRLIDDRF